MARLLILVAAIAAVFSAAPADASMGWTECSHHIADKNMMPHEVPNSVRICRDGVIAVSYDKTMINPAFAMYYATPEQARNIIPGREGFFQDPDLKREKIKQAAVSSKVFSNDWNRGHLAPSRLLSYSTVSKKAVYTMANIAPQGGYFNQHPWEYIESKVVNWVINNKALYILTGVAYKDRSNPTRGVDDIAIPDYYWKVLCEPVSGNAVGFWGVNEPTTRTTTDFVPISQIERLYGGKVLPTSKCNTISVNRTFWW